MKWIGELFYGLFRALFGWGQEQADRPNTAEQAATPPAKLSAWQNAVRKFKAKKDAETKPK